MPCGSAVDSGAFPTLLLIVAVVMVGCSGKTDMIIQTLFFTQSVHGEEIIPSLFYPEQAHRGALNLKPIYLKKIRLPFPVIIIIFRKFLKFNPMKSLMKSNFTLKEMQLDSINKQLISQYMSPKTLICTTIVRPAYNYTIVSYILYGSTICEISSVIFHSTTHVMCACVHGLWSIRMMLF